MSLDSNLQSAFIAVGTAIKGKISSSEKGVANGVATLDGGGKIPSTQLPSFVDDVVEYANFAALPGTGAAGIMYVTLDTNRTYRWSGSAYIQITSGGVDSVAGKTGVVTLVKGDVGLGNVDNTADNTKSVASAATLVTGRTIAITGDVTYTSGSFDGSGNVTGAATLANSGVTASTYKSVTVDAKGRVTAGTNPTTLSGYGITDAAPSTHVGATGAAHGAATTSVAGFMSATDKTKLDGIASGATAYTLPVGTTAVLGGIKINSDTVQTVAASAVTTTASRTYGLQINASGQGVVNIPWTDTVYTHPSTHGSLLVPATSTTNNGKFLMAGATAGSLSWASAPVTTVAGRTGAVTLTVADVTGAQASSDIGATDTNYVTVFNAALV